MTLSANFSYEKSSEITFSRECKRIGTPAGVPIRERELPPAPRLVPTTGALGAFANPEWGSRCVQSQTRLQTAATVAGLLFVAANAQSCWNDAAARYGLSSHLLYAIARAESGLNSRAIGRNRDGSRDIGLMQINSWWLPVLARHGIHERDLYEPCTSIHVGAWILAQNVARHGYTWEAVGAYHATSPQLRAAYVDRVRRHLPTHSSHDRTPMDTPLHSGRAQTPVSIALHP